MQPAAQGVAGADRAGLPGQDQEGGLEGVLDVVLVPQDGAAGGQDHRAVPGDQGLEGGLVAVGGVTGQELAVAQADGRAVVEQVAEVPQGPPQRSRLPWMEILTGLARCPGPSAAGEPPSPAASCTG